MLSKVSNLKPEAIRLRQQGYSIRYIEQKLGISRSTLSGWLKAIILTSEQVFQLKDNWSHALEKARIKAIIWHNEQKKNRLAEAEQQAEAILFSINAKDKNIQQLALAILYLGEGFKTKPEQLGIGNSNPLILRFFIKIYTANFNVARDSIKCELYLRIDQNADEMKRYWAKELELPIKNFTYVSFDKRTIGTKTFPSYHGVCTLRCGNVAVKRKLMYIAEKYCQKILRTVSSAG